MTERIVVGSSVAALVTAQSLAERGERARLLMPPGPPGGGFGSIRSGGRALELGVRLLELSYEQAAPPPPLSSYQPGPAGHRPYAMLVRDHLEALLGSRLTEVRRPQMLFDGRVVDDLYFTTDATALRTALTSTQRAEIRTEALACQASTGSGAGVLAPELIDRLDTLTLEEASLLNHGESFHRLFMAPVANKIVAGGCTDVIAALRRKIWLPLFWPQTLAQAAGDGDISFAPERPFHTIAGGGSGELVAGLIERLDELGVVMDSLGALEGIETGASGLTRLSMANGDVIEAARPVIGVSAGQLFGAAGIDYQPEAARTVICWLEVADDDLLDLPSLLNVVDADIPALRLSSGGLGAPGRTILTVELRHDTEESEIASAAMKSVEQMSILRPGAEMVELRSGAIRSFPLPTHANAQRFEAASAAFAERNIDAEIVGAGLQFGADALGEQIIQGLRAAEVLTA